MIPLSSRPAWVRRYSVRFPRVASLLKYPPNLVNPPHHHPLDEELTVLSGTLYLGHGETMDPAKARALPPGSFIVEPAKTRTNIFAE